MATVQAQLLQLAHTVNPVTARGQRFRGSGSSVAVTGAANNGAGLIRLTANGHGLRNNHRAYVTGVGGTIEANNTLANPSWPVLRIDANTVDLVGSVFSNAFISNGTIVSALVGSVDGSKFTSQRFLDIYNKARRRMIERAAVKLEPEARAWVVSGAILSKTDLTFTTGIAPKPSGYLELVRLTDSAGKQIDVLSAELQDRYKDRDSLESPVVFDMGANLESLNGLTFIPNAATYKLRYFGVSDFTLADVLGNTVSETINERLQPGLLDLAALIASEQGEQKLNALADTLIQKAA